MEIDDYDTISSISDYFHRNKFVQTDFVRKIDDLYQKYRSLEDSTENMG
jgi:hypothetical protein